MIYYLYIAIIIAETLLKFLLSFSFNTSYSCLQKAIINRTRKSKVKKQLTVGIKEYLKQNEKSYTCIRVHVPCHAINEQTVEYD